MSDFIELGNIGFIRNVPVELSKLESENKTLKFTLIGLGFGILVIAVIANINFNKFKNIKLEKKKNESNN